MMAEKGTKARRHEGTKGAACGRAAGDVAGLVQSALRPLLAFNRGISHFVPSCLRAFVPLVALATAAGQDTILNSKHDLSVFGPGPVRAIEESQVCIFCHAPHNASPAAPLWNRHNPTSYYRIYESSTTDARIDQPGGSSKLCLSCHDGSIALGLVHSRPATDPIPMNHLYIPSGASDLTNDLSDDHPIGFRYDRALANRDRQLRSPDLVSREIKLGPRGELQCIACHEPHNNEFGDFLRITDRQGALCVTCHDMDGWRTSIHALSPASVPPSLAAVDGGLSSFGQPGDLRFRSMADAACASCHMPHSANERERLLRDEPHSLCLECHNGLTASDIHSVLNQRSGHRVLRNFRGHDAAESPLTMRAHVSCVDCHNPHAVMQTPGGARFAQFDSRDPFVPPAMNEVDGVSLSGIPVERARFYYEVCFRCHADNPVPTRNRIVRQRDAVGNIRRQVLPTAASSHPLTFASRGGGEVPSLRPELRGTVTLSCQDCHNNPDARQLGGAGPNGPHGSRFEHLLIDRYETADFTMESPQSYALCYRCHDRNSILADESFAFHSQHIVRGQSACSACHDPHGVTGSRANHSHLINFDVSVVSGERLFIDTGRFSGSCTLTCHGVRHVNFTYGAAAGP